jgi:hypothetical protein
VKFYRKKQSTPLQNNIKLVAELDAANPILEREALKLVKKSLYL